MIAYSQPLKEWLDKVDEACMEAVKAGAMSAAWRMAFDARRILATHPQRRTDKFAHLLEGIVASGPHTTVDGDTIVKVHAAGFKTAKGDPLYDTFKTRFFVVGTKTRYRRTSLPSIVHTGGPGRPKSYVTDLTRNYGSIQACDAITKAANIEILKNSILNRIKNNSI